MTWRKYISKLEIKLKSNLIGMGCFMLTKKNKSVCLYKKEAVSVSVFISRKGMRKRLHFYYIHLCCQTKNRYFKICTKFKKRKKLYKREQQGKRTREIENFYGNRTEWNLNGAEIQLTKISA